MRIGLFTDGYIPQINGVATSTEELARSLRKLGHQVTVVAPQFPLYNETDGNVLRLKSIKVVKNPEIRLAYMFPDNILRQVVSKKFDIIHGFSGGSIPSLGLVLAMLKRKPYVFTYNTRYNKYTHYILNGKLVRPKAVEKVMAIFCNKCSAIVAPSLSIKKEIMGFGVKKPIHVIPNGVDIEKFSSSKPTNLRQKYNIKDNDKIVLYVGRLAKEKSIEFLIRVFKKLSKINKNVYFIIVGEGPHRRILEKMVLKLGLNSKVIFTGYIPYDKVPGVYREADVFVFSSVTETQGMVILEAMASGLPVLAVKDEVFEDIIESGKDGIIEKQDEAKFFKQLKTILENDNLRKTISRNAIKKAKKFSLAEKAKEFDTLYKNLLK